MHFLIHPGEDFYMNYLTNVKAVRSAFQSYQFITLSKTWSQSFVQLSGTRPGWMGL